MYAIVSNVLEQPTVEPALNKPFASQKKLLLIALLIILIIFIGIFVVRKKRLSRIQLPQPSPTVELDTSLTTLEQNLNTFSEHITSFEENSSILDEINQSYELK